ncbi:MAG: acyl-CoA thioesterase [Hyphomicrobiales bacterium]|nr:acyl-CoA thioesterase [Hyphomicrobiales bacterium]
MFLTRTTIEWGDCDEAGIIFYPNYFYIFDTSYQRFLRSAGLSQRKLREKYSAITPLVEAGAQFRAPISYDDEVSIEMTLADIAEKRFRIAYRILRGETLAAEGFEQRAFAVREPSGKLRGAPIDPAFRALLEDKLAKA